MTREQVAEIQRRFKAAHDAGQIEVHGNLWSATSGKEADALNKAAADAKRPECEYSRCRGPVVQVVRRLWQDDLMHLCEKHAMNGADAEGLIPNNYGFPTSYRVVSDARTEGSK